LTKFCRFWREKDSSYFNLSSKYHCIAHGLKQELDKGEGLELASVDDKGEDAKDTWAAELPSSHPQVFSFSLFIQHLLDPTATLFFHTCNVLTISLMF
jgi:hypothetical protein